MFVLDPILIAKVGGLLFFAILFLQSGIDKTRDRAGNLAWMEPHFAQSPFAGKVPMLLTALTVLELVSGALSLVAAMGAALHPVLSLVMLRHLPGLAMTFVLATFLMLFLGQRLAKDYAGAASLAAYFAVALLTLVLPVG